MKKLLDADWLIVTLLKCNSSAKKCNSSAKICNFSANYKFCNFDWLEKQKKVETANQI